MTKRMACCNGPLNGSSRWDAKRGVWACYDCDAHNHIGYDFGVYKPFVREEHDFNNYQMKCSKCNANNTIYNSVLPTNCSNTVLSCCGGKGTSVWDNSVGAWKCRDCGSSTSTDPSYTGKINLDEPPQWPSWVKKCECGSTKTYGTGATHASYCPLWGKP